MDWFKKFFIDEVKPAAEFYSGIASGSGPDDMTYILVDEAGRELSMVLTDEEVDITATANDIRLGVTAVTDDGITVGEKEIPSYYVYEGIRVVTNGSKFTITHEKYDYTKLQAIMCEYNTNLNDSVAAVKVSINDNVYDVGSAVSLAEVFKDSENGRIDFGITNETGGMCILRYFMYKEIY